MAAAYPGKQAAQAEAEARRFVIRTAQKLLADVGMRKPPIVPEGIAEWMQIRVTKADLGALSGCLVPAGDKLEIRINAAHSVKRQRFSCAHEICHTFFLDEQGEGVKARVARFRGGPNTGDWEEKLCDAGAAELLMPLLPFVGLASRYGYSIECLPVLSTTFETSILTTALRLREVSPRRCVVRFWRVDDKDPLAAASFRAWGQVKSKSAPLDAYFVSYRIYRDRRSTVWEAYNSDGPVRTTERFPLGKRSVLCDHEAQGFGKGENRYVVSLIFPHEHGG